MKNQTLVLILCLQNFIVSVHYPAIDSFVIFTGAFLLDTAVDWGSVIDQIIKFKHKM